MDQTQACVRTASAADAEAVRTFLAGLSPETQYLRFFTGLGSVSPSLVRELVSDTPRQRSAIALRGAEVIGHAMAATDAGTVELGVVVADGHRRRGLGTRLVRTLLERAIRTGADRLRMDLLCENRVVLDWIRRDLPDTVFERDGYTLTGYTPLSPAMLATEPPLPLAV